MLNISMLKTKTKTQKKHKQRYGFHLDSSCVPNQRCRKPNTNNGSSIVQCHHRLLHQPVCDCPRLHDDDRLDHRPIIQRAAPPHQQWQSNNATWKSVSRPAVAALLHYCIIATQLLFKFGTALIRLIALRPIIVHCIDCRVRVNFSDCLRPSFQPLQV